jgi:hypothetical protein
MRKLKPADTQAQASLRLPGFNISDYLIPHNFSIFRVYFSLPLKIQRDEP